jgi:hypothetical protein
MVWDGTAAIVVSLEALWSMVHVACEDVSFRDAEAEGRRRAGGFVSGVVPSK